METILIVIFALVAGYILGNRVLWWQMNRIWKKYPEQFKTIVEGVIALREERANKQ